MLDAWAGVGKCSMLGLVWVNARGVGRCGCAGGQDPTGLGQANLLADLWV